MCPGPDLFGIYQRMDESCAVCVLCIDHTSSQQHEGRICCPGAKVEQGCHNACYNAPSRFGKTKSRTVRGYDQITGQHQAAAAGDRCSIHRRDQGLWKPEHRLDDVQVDSGIGVPLCMGIGELGRSRHFFQIHSCAKRRSCARENYRTHLFFKSKIMQRLAQFVQ